MSERLTKAEREEMRGRLDECACTSCGGSGCDPNADPSSITTESCDSCGGSGAHGPAVSRDFGLWPALRRLLSGADAADREIERLEGEKEAALATAGALDRARVRAREQRDTARAELDRWRDTARRMAGEARRWRDQAENGYIVGNCRDCGREIREHEGRNWSGGDLYRCADCCAALEARWAIRERLTNA